MSLLALVLAIGIVVDDAIVVVENVERVMQEHPEMEPHEATLEAMRQITGPIIAISLVLLSVFVPVAFIPGISGQLFRQFAVTISIAMLISAVNALTLSPALCAIFLRHEIPTRGPIYQVLHGINLVRDGYARIVQRLIRVSLVSLPLVVLIGAGIFGLARITPTSFLPEEDQGAFFLNIQLPDGASVARTSETVRQVEAILKTMPQVQDVFAVIGFSLLDGANYVERRLRRRQAQAVRGPPRRRRFGAGPDPPHVRRGPADPHRQHRRLQPAADHRPVDQRRLRVPARGAVSLTTQQGPCP